MKRLVGIVALNRLQSEQFPNACVVDGNINKKPTDECIEIAKDLLINGYNEPKYIIYQAEFEQVTETYVDIPVMLERQYF